MTHTLTSAIAAARRATEGTQLRAVDYLRVSTEEQKKGYGIAYTGKKTKRHMEKKGWVYVRTYADEGYSGSLDHTQRPDLKRLMADALQEPRPFDVVVVPEERAIGRRDRAFWPWVWKLEDHGIFVAVVRGDYDNTTEEGRSRMRKEQDRAEDERITIRDRTQGGRQEKAELGGHPGGVAPYGYRIENQGVKGESRLVLDDEGENSAYDLLHRAANLIIDEGKTAGQVESLFNSEGLPGPGKDHWTRGSVRHVLTSRAVQQSVFVHRDPKGRKTRVDADGNPIFGDSVTIELDPVFDELKLLRLNKALERTSFRRTTSEATHPLSGHVFGMCGAHYIGRSNTGRNSVRVYTCTGKKSEKSNQKCSCSQVDAESLEKRVWDEVCKLLADPARLRQMAEDWVEMSKANGVDYDKRIEELDEQIDDLDAAIGAATAVASKNAVRRKLGPKEIEEAIDRAVRPLEEEREKLAALRNEAVSWREEMKASVTRARDLQALSELARENLHTMRPQEQAEVLHRLDVKVTILGDIQRKVRSDDGISTWFRSRGRTVPYLTDEAWAIVEPIFLSRPGRRAKDPRGLLTDMLCKARTGCPWTALERSPADIWQRWCRIGLWDALMDALEGVPGSSPSGDPTLPPLRVEGRVDPRLLLTEDQSAAEDDVFKASAAGVLRFCLELAS